MSNETINAHMAASSRLEAVESAFDAALLGTVQADIHLCAQEYAECSERNAIAKRTAMNVWYMYRAMVDGSDLLDSQVVYAR